jgi:esterase/lipase superfamily enzyme
VSVDERFGAQNGPRLCRNPLISCCSTRERLRGKKDGLIRISQAVHAYLKEKDVPHVWHVDGNAHDATEWKNNLYLFSQRIFR